MVALSLDPSKPASSSTCHPPLVTSCMACLLTSCPPPVPCVRLLLHLAARVAPIVVAHLAAPPPRPPPDRPPAPVACQPRGTLAAPRHGVPRVAPRHRRRLLLGCPSRLRLLLLTSSSARLALSRNAGVDAHAVVHHPVRLRLHPCQHRLVRAHFSLLHRAHQRRQRVLSFLPASPHTPRPRASRP